MAESDSSVADARKNCVNQVMQKRALLSKAGEPADVAVDAIHNRLLKSKHSFTFAVTVTVTGPGVPLC